MLFPFLKGRAAAYRSGIAFYLTGLWIGLVDFECPVGLGVAGKQGLKCFRVLAVYVRSTNSPRSPIFEEIQASISDSSQPTLFAPSRTRRGNSPALSFRQIWTLE